MSYWRLPFFPTSSDVHQCPTCGVYVVVINGKYDQHQYGTEDVKICDASGQPIPMEKTSEET